MPPRLTMPKFGLPKPLAKRTNTGRHRISPRARGYDAYWDRLARAHKQAFPFCAFCQQLGRDTLTEVTDHILPAYEFPDLRYAWENLQSLCSHHHDTTKQRLEHYARQNGCLERLREWCADLRTAPAQFRPAFPT